MSEYMFDLVQRGEAESLESYYLRLCAVAMEQRDEALDALEAIVESAAKAYINDWVPQELEHAEAILRKHGRVS